MEEIIEKANVLMEALPYILKFKNKIFVIKYGGSIIEDEFVTENILRDIVFIRTVGICPVVVHGGGKNISEKMKQSGKQAVFVQGLRISDEETVKIADQALTELNEQIVQKISQLGAAAIDMAKKNRVVIADKKITEPDLGLVGEVCHIRTSSIIRQIDKGNIPVISPIGISREGSLYNINADEVASAVASYLEAEKLILITDVPGILRDKETPDSLISSLDINGAKQLIDDKTIDAGMLPKVQSCIYAIERGVKKTHIVDSRIPHTLLLEIFTDKGVGTQIVR
jgi:acetylglutamate kinase